MAAAPVGRLDESGSGIVFATGGSHVWRDTIPGSGRAWHSGFGADRHVAGAGPDGPGGHRLGFEQPSRPLVFTGRSAVRRGGRHRRVRTLLPRARGTVLLRTHGLGHASRPERPEPGANRAALVRRRVLRGVRDG